GAHRSAHRGRVSHVPQGELQTLGAMALAQPAQVALHARAREIVQDVDVLTPLQQPVHQVGANEARPAEYQRGTPHVPAAHTVNPPHSSPARIPATRSTATWPRSHRASSARPSSKRTRGSYPSTWRAREMSAKQWRTSPTRQRPVTSGWRKGLPRISAI